MGYTESDLEKRGVVPWEWVADAFLEHNLFLGNGFSVNLCDRLSYQSIFKKFIDNTAPDLQKLFESLGTTNFELILEVLNNSELVNSLIDLPIEEIRKLKETLKNELITTIQQNHPAHEEISYPQLRSIADEVREFKNVFTTNYDIFLYKIALEIISEFRDQGLNTPFQDQFYKTLHPTALAFQLDPAYPETPTLYYLHGALFIYQTEDRSTNYKLKKLDSRGIEYIKLIGREISNENMPVFVAEGESKDKLRAIRRNSYLNFCANKLQHINGNLTIYGFSFGESDTHILDILNK